MFNILINNLQLIIILLAAYLISLGINTLLGIYYNVKQIKEEFSKEKLLNGLARGGIILVGGVLITVVVSLLPEILKQFGISAPDNLFEDLSIVAIAGVLVSSIATYLNDALRKFYSILRGDSNNT